MWTIYGAVAPAADATSVTDWISSIAEALTFVIAIGALVYAARQLSEAKSARALARELDEKTQALTRELDIERSQPYVVMYMEPSVASQVLIDLVVKNYGQTAARNLRIELDPWPSRSNPEGPVGIPATIPVLAPGQEWRTMWDSGLTRRESDLPDRHIGTVSFDGLNGRRLTSEVDLDWSIYKERRWVEIRTTHDAAKALREMSAILKKWNEGPSGGLQVFTRDGDKKDQRTQEEYRRYLEEMETERQATATLQSAASETELPDPHPGDSDG